ncbi:MAG: HAD-IC family P-type ATPase [Saprospiraceae bacterium]|nr:HAD-IC family P-type ATPase [Saprospiraceae bacterium]
MSNTELINETVTRCTHCGNDCRDESIKEVELIFCCSGCLVVYQLLTKHNLSSYYNFEEFPGSEIKNQASHQYAYLDDPSVIEKLLLFNENGLAKVSFKLPQIHCSACLYLLENIGLINEAIYFSKVDFLKKKAVFHFRINEVSLRELAELLSKIGYKPELQFDKLDEQKTNSKAFRVLAYKIGLSGFAFGNIMLFSFPEYLGFVDGGSVFYLSYINIALIIPVLLYSASDYFVSAYKSLTFGKINLDFPIVLGMATLFLRSLYEILFQVGEGYLDSLAGFVFFLLIGKWFQSVTYQQLDFNRSYKSYFPISIMVKEGFKWFSKSIDQIVKGDILMIRNQELIPVDCKLLRGKARIDYSFVTGESDLMSKEINDLLLAGGRQVGESIEVEVTKKVDQSFLTQLWNEGVFKENLASSSSQLINQVSKYFTITIIGLALSTLVYWWFKDDQIAFTSFTSVLIVACPCALALAMPFTYGNIIRLLARIGIYLRSVEVIEHIQDANFIAFDKTGTITDSQKMKVTFEGEDLNERNASSIKSLCVHSSHPMSQAIVDFLDDVNTSRIENFVEHVGEGLEAEISGTTIRLGSSSFIFGTIASSQSGVFVQIDGRYIGHFNFAHEIRKNIRQVLSQLKAKFALSLLSGDSNRDQKRMASLLGENAEIKFNASPKEKLSFIQSKQKEGYKVMMVGDGLNDAGALKQSNVGVVISDNVNNFSPSCDVILDAKSFDKFGDFITYLQRARLVIYGAFFLAIVYNLIGLGFAVTGNLKPIIAAILMPLSSITIIIYGLVASYLTFQSAFK